MEVALRFLLIGLVYFLNIVSFVLFAYAILSWFLPKWHKVMVIMARYLEPILSPFRKLSQRIMPAGTPLDLSILFAIISVQVASRILNAFL